MTVAPPVILRSPGLALAAVLASALAGCTHDRAGDAGASLEDTIQPRSRMMALAPEGAGGSRLRPAVHPRMVSLPSEAGPAGPPRSRDYADGYRQDVALGGGPRIAGVANGVTLLLRSSARDTLDERVPLFKPTEASIRSEIGAQFPHLAMQVAPRESSNLYGPYGLALGRAGGDVRCLYMWQWIDANRMPREAEAAGPASVRVRLCRAGMSFDAMAALVDHLAIGPGSDAEIAAADDVRVIAATPEVGGGATGAHRHPRRLAQHRRRPTTVARHEENAEVALAAPAPAPEGPRYMMPLTGLAAPRAPAPPVTPAASATSGLGGDLPPEAFAGPRPSTVRSPRSY